MSPGAAPRSSGARRERIALVVAAVLVVVGVLVHVTAPPLAFSWFAYTPLPAEIYTPGLDLGWLLGDTRRIAGTALIALGVVLAATALGHLAGRRSATTPPVGPSAGAST